MKRTRIIALIIVLVLMLSLVPYNYYVSDTGVKIHQAFLYALAQKRNAQGDYEFSRIYWFPESLNSDENLHKKEMASWRIS